VPFNGTEPAGLPRIANTSIDIASGFTFAVSTTGIVFD
jgi:hypothetical protein